MFACKFSMNQHGCVQNGAKKCARVRSSGKNRKMFIEHKSQFQFLGLISQKWCCCTGFCSRNAAVAAAFSLSRKSHFCCTDCKAYGHYVGFFPRRIFGSEKRARGEIFSWKVLVLCCEFGTGCMFWERDDSRAWNQSFQFSLFGVIGIDFHGISGRTILFNLFSWWNRPYSCRKDVPNIHLFAWNFHCNIIYNNLWNHSHL